MHYSNTFIEDLINEARCVLHDVYEDIQKLNKKEPNYDFTRENLKNLSLSSFDIHGYTLRPTNFEEKQAENKQERQLEDQLLKAARSVYISPPNSDVDDESAMDEEEEAEKLNQYFKTNALRPVHKIEPGRLPYRHDHLLKLKQYKEQWDQNPVICDKDRRSHRWNVRRKMMEQDIPRITFKAKKGSSQKEEFRV